MGLNQAIDITTSQRKTILELLEKHLPNTTAWVYGSRVKWTSRPQSDLDLVVFSAPDQNRKVSDLRKAFEDSNLPFRVDLFVWDEVPAQFQKLIKAEHVVLVEKEERGRAGKWREVALGEFVEIYDGPHATPKKTASGHVFLGISNLNNGRLNLAQTNHLSEIDFKRWTRRVTPQKDDIVFSYETRLGEAALIPPNLRCCLGRRMGLLRPKRDNIDSRFLLYAFLGKRFQDTLRSRTVHGSTVDRILLTEMGSFPIELPLDIEEQRAIAHILGTLDDKIELNRRMNETLEAMARALFKSWFVDFDPVRAKSALKRHKSITPPLRGSRQGKGASPQASRWGVSLPHSPQLKEIKRLYSPLTLKRAKALRQSRSDAEGLLWHYLRKKQLDGHKFRRQQPIGRYIVDFVCMAEKLVIELDGGQHSTQRAYDEQRDQFLTERGYRVLRFWNSVVFENCYGVLENILAALRHDPVKGTEYPPPQPAEPVATPPQGESDWTVERAEAYFDRMDPDIADLFPDQLVASELGEIPEGWEVGYLADIAVASRRGVDPTGLPYETPYIGLEHMPRHSIALAEWGDTRKVTSSKSNFEKGNVLFGKLRPYFHKVGIAPVNGICSTDIVVIVPKGTEWSSFVLACVSSNVFVSYTNQTSTGTKMPRTSWKIMGDYRMCLPTAPVVLAFQAIMHPVLELIVANIHESRVLSTLRDVLLPKLVSGEIHVKNSKFMQKGA